MLMLLVGSIIDLACFYSFDEVDPDFEANQVFIIFCLVSSVFLAILFIFNCVKRIEWSNGYKEFFHSEWFTFIIKFQTKDFHN